MGLLSIFKRNSAAPARQGPVELPADSVQRARAKARQRLVGAVVLVVIAVIAFPLVFETQPRPIPVDIAIEIPRKDNVPALVAPAPRQSPASSPVPAKGASVEWTEQGKPALREGTRDAPAQPAAPASGAGAISAAQPAAPKAAAEPARPPTAAAPSTTPPANPGSVRTKPAANAIEPAGPSGARFVVQVGAFAEAAAAQTTRAKAEKLGLKTYTQVAETSAGNRIRVRIGPFASREAAEQVLAKAKAGGLNAVVLTL